MINEDSDKTNAKRKRSQVKMTRLLPPDPGEIRQLMKKYRLNRKETADLIYLSVRQLEDRLLPVDSKTHRRMSMAEWELLQRKAAEIGKK